MYCKIRYGFCCNVYSMLEVCDLEYQKEGSPEVPLTARQQMLLLAQMSFYCGVGYKTAMGLGQARPV